MRVCACACVNACVYVMGTCTPVCMCIRVNIVHAYFCAFDRHKRLSLKKCFCSLALGLDLDLHGGTFNWTVQLIGLDLSWPVIQKAPVVKP